MEAAIAVSDSKANHGRMQGHVGMNWEGILMEQRLGRVEGAK